MTETLDVSYYIPILILYQLFDSFSEVFLDNPIFEKCSSYLVAILFRW